MSPDKSLKKQTKSNKQKSSNSKNSGNGEWKSIIATIYYVKCPVFIKKMYDMQGNWSLYRFESLTCNTFVLFEEFFKYFLQGRSTGDKYL